ncbi:OLC1v1036238C2 [Oldenlandia corymbosa var. corymbosa]|uniref:OLC1v1036238C2 n=1 Tax=Oldenlandia corymbosa var. corymbosa TaxID=529605 RepID=A0AAV1CUV3_OLDCO|nr:OLC1v1036238C2 [Oldenlandia corymbosa var. corymbosa]
MDRKDGVDDSYSVLIRFDGQTSADHFYMYFNGKHFSSLEVDICRVLFTIDVQFTGSIEHAQTSPVGFTEQPSCPVCLERLDQDMGGTLTTICNHSFHCSCISKWTDSSCPVCRYCQQQPEKSNCFVCQTSENLWMCIICGYIGCGRFRERHAIQHWKDTEHCYSLELETRRVWDYAGDNYVHRLIQSKTDGKLIELNRHCALANDGCGTCECGMEAEFGDVQMDNKVDAIVNEYNELLAIQLESQKQYFETLIEDAEEENRKEVAEAVEKASSQNPKLVKLQAKLDKCVEEKNFLDDINDNLLRNQEMWQAKIAQYEESQSVALELKNKKIEELEEMVNSHLCSLFALLGISIIPHKASLMVFFFFVFCKCSLTF